MSTLELTLPYARTTAGESELHEASHGLSLVQRKLLSAFNGQIPANELELEHRLDPELIQRSLSRLVDLGLIAAEADTNPQPAIGPAKTWSKPRGLPIIPIVAVALLLVAAFAYWGLKNNHPASDATVAATAKPHAEKGGAAAGDNAPAAPRALPAMDGPGESSNPLFKLWAQNKATEDALAIKQAAQKPAEPVVASKPPASPAPIAAAAPAKSVEIPAANPSREAAATVAAKPADPAPLPAPAIAPAPAATQKVATAPPATPAPLRVLSREAPTFPREAIVQGINSGIVKVRLSVDGTGAVTNVTILEAQPRRVFDKAVIRALGLWKFEASGAAQVVDTEVVFNGQS